MTLSWQVSPPKKEVVSLHSPRAVGVVLITAWSRQSGEGAGTPDQCLCHHLQSSLALLFRTGLFWPSNCDVIQAYCPDRQEWWGLASPLTVFRGFPNLVFCCWLGQTLLWSGQLYWTDLKTGAVTSVGDLQYSWLVMVGEWLHPTATTLKFN